MAETAKSLPPEPAAIDQRVFFHGISWAQFEAMLAMRGDRGSVRFTYLEGELELMSPSRHHEMAKKTIARLLEAFAEERGIELEGFGSWTIKDELVRRGHVYYAKLARGKAMFLAARMVPHFHAIWGVRRSEEGRCLSKPARAILKVLRSEWEMASSDLRKESGLTDRVAFTRAIDELQAAMIVVPSEAVYLPKFTYLWTLSIGRFPDAMLKRVHRPVALREIARCFLSGAGMTVPGELARVTGLSRPEAGLGNRALVAEGFATSPSRGFYQLTVTSSLRTA